LAAQANKLRLGRCNKLRRVWHRSGTRRRFSLEFVDGGDDLCAKPLAGDQLCKGNKVIDAGAFAALATICSSFNCSA
jgi:hypothetical protein